MIGGKQFRIRQFRISEESLFNRIVKAYLMDAPRDQNAFIRFASLILERFPRKWYESPRPGKRFLKQHLPLSAKKEIFEAALFVNLGLDVEGFFEDILQMDGRKIKDKFHKYAYAIVEGLKWTPHQFQQATLAQLRIIQDGAQDAMAEREFEEVKRKARRG